MATAGTGPATLATLSREDLLDKYLRLRDDHERVKKENKDLDILKKKMATKLIRLTGDAKKDDAGGGAAVENRERIAELDSQVFDLKQRNEKLTRRLKECRQQMEVNKPQGPYRNVKARIDSGIRQPPSAEPAVGIKVPKQPVPQPQGSPSRPRYGHSLLEEERVKSAEYQEIIFCLEADLNEHQMLLAATKEEHDEKLKLQHAHHLEELEKAKQALIQTQRKNISDDATLIRLHRELKEKCVLLESLETKFLTAEQQIEKLKVNHSGLLSEVSDLQERLQEKEHKCHQLQSSLTGQKVTKQTITELQDMVEELRVEKKLLQESNNKLVSAAFDVQQERQHKAQLQLLQDRNELLETGKKKLLVDKSEVLEQLANEKEHLAKLRHENQTLSSNLFKLKEENEKLLEKMEFFSTESSVDFSELEEALALVKSRKLHLLQPLPSDTDVNASAIRKSQSDLHRLQTVFTQTRQELEKTRHLLELQCKINSDLEAEKKLMTKKLTDCQAESEERSREQAELLSKRMTKIHHLQKQLHDLAYGTKQLKLIPTTVDDDEDFAGGFGDQNVLEIHIGELDLSSDAQDVFNETPFTWCFISLDFFQFESVMTQSIPSTCKSFNYTAEYPVVADDFLIHGLQSMSWCVQVHGACGAKQSVVAVGQLHLQDLLSEGKSQERLHGTVTLVGTGDHLGVPFGIVTFWSHLRCPMEHAVQVYRKRAKALGYLSANKGEDEEEANKTNQAAMDSSSQMVQNDDNTLKVTVVSCSHLPHADTGQQPSAYAVYRLFNSDEYPTRTVHRSNNPQINDSHHFKLPISLELDEYLHSQVLTFFVFDDDDSSHTRYIGTADLVLLPLTQQSSLLQECPLLSPKGKSAGTIEVKLSWQQEYQACADTAK